MQLQTTPPGLLLALTEFAHACSLLKFCRCSSGTAEDLRQSCQSLLSVRACARLTQLPRTECCSLSCCSCQVFCAATLSGAALGLFSCVLIEYGKFVEVVAFCQPRSLHSHLDSGTSQDLCSNKYRSIASFEVVVSFPSFVGALVGYFPYIMT